ncbi:MAG: hypothetical protein A2X49_14775 [Lentisphaerae bacterium GWF2_52_8]|nr:MAG: hypothetical protein A2X49_14775 [Lentisphaerae bacterium GWF2_52_8]
MKISIISNLRHSAQPGEFGDVFLRRAVQRLLKYIKPDLLFLAGDLLSTPEAEDAKESWMRLTRILSVLQCPIIARGGRPSPGMLELYQTLPNQNALPKYLDPRLLALLDQAPPLQSPLFPFLVAETNAQGAPFRVETCELKMPQNMELTDFHIHTRAAYCNNDLDAVKTVELASQFGLKSAVILEHSGQLYFESPDYWNNVYSHAWPNTRKIDRSSEFFAEFEQSCRAARIPVFRGFELDVSDKGEPVILPDTLKQAQVRLGAVHSLSSSPDFSDWQALKKEFLFKVKSLLQNQIDVLAHPFRIFQWLKLPVPPDLFEPVAELLKSHRTAAELNFHANVPEPEFFELCIKKGIKIAFGSDSHSLYEIGEFYPHLKLLEQFGVLGRLDEIVLKKHS